VTTGQLTCHSAQNAKAIKFTYLKEPASGFLLDRKFSNETATKAGADPYTNTFAYPILLWGYSGQFPVNGQTTKVIISYADTPATGEVVADWFSTIQRGAGAPANGTQFGLKDNHTGTAAGVWGKISEIAPHPIELRAGLDISFLSSVKGLFLGA
jgi:hypothetical protein